MIFIVKMGLATHFYCKHTWKKIHFRPGFHIEKYIFTQEKNPTMHVQRVTRHHVQSGIKVPKVGFYVFYLVVNRLSSETTSSFLQ